MPSSVCPVNQHNICLSKLLRVHIIYAGRNQYIALWKPRREEEGECHLLKKKSRNTEIERGASKALMAANQRGNGTHEDTPCPKFH